MSSTLSCPPPAPSERALRTLVDGLLHEQGQLTAVDEFERALEESLVPDQARYYRALLPARPLRDGEQYGFEVNLDRCSGCKACVTACHSLNGLDENETWRSVGLLVGTRDERPVLQHVTTACHHCVEPGCLSACPTLAYEKDPVTGIVKHLDDQCFGCQYCTLACPYGVPQYHAGKGIVRKCDLCSQRLARDEAPACVQACPHEAIRVAIVSVAEARERATRGEFLDACPAPHHTTPTTRYTSQRGLVADGTGHGAKSANGMSAADRFAIAPGHSHPPLAAMLAGSQWSVGMYVALAMLTTVPNSLFSPVSLCHFVLTLFAFGLGALSIAVATLHLGRPWLAYRAILGWRTSWLSREALVFGLFMACATAGLAASVNVAPNLLGIPQWIHHAGFVGWMAPLHMATAITGVAGVWCSVMIYAVTPRPFWNVRDTALKFFGTSFIAMAWTISTAGLMEIAGEHLSPHATISASSWYLVIFGSTLLLVGWSVKVGNELALLTTRERFPNHWRARTAHLLNGALSGLVRWRVVCATCGAVSLLAAIGAANAFGSSGTSAMEGVSSMSNLSLPTLAVTVGCGAAGLFWLASELIERTCFFTAESTPGMPGGNGS